MQLTGIRRAQTFSPHQHAENDRLILEAVSQVLQRMGCQIRTLTEETVGETPIDTEVVFSMCQGARANDALIPLEDQGHLIINSPRAVKRCYRQNLFRDGELAHPLLPRTRLIRTEAHHDLPRLLNGFGSLWVKRGDVHSTQDGDVIRVDSIARLEAVLDSFRERGIHTAALQHHVEGTVVKFYGVRGTPFFRFYAEKDRNLHPVSFSLARPEIEALVAQVGLQIYGGDAVIDAQGRVLVIDVNDWPSFASYRAEAAEAIAHRIFELALAHRSRRTLRSNPRRAVMQQPSPRR